MYVRYSHLIFLRDKVAEIGSQYVASSRKIRMSCGEIYRKKNN